MRQQDSNPHMNPLRHFILFAALTISQYVTKAYTEKYLSSIEVLLANREHWEQSYSLCGGRSSLFLCFIWCGLQLPIGLFLGQWEAQICFIWFRQSDCRLRPAPSQPCSALLHCTGEIERQAHLEIA